MLLPTSSSSSRRILFPSSSQSMPPSRSSSSSSLPPPPPPPPPPHPHSVGVVSTTRARARCGRRILVGVAAVLVVVSYIRALGRTDLSRNGSAELDGSSQGSTAHLRINGRSILHQRDIDRVQLRTSHTDHVSWTTVDDIPDTTDFYSASWMMSVQQFVERDYTDRIVSLEDGVFAAISGRDHFVRMTLDYLDLAVEHLSHWWRMVGVPHNDAGYNYTIRQLASYVSRHVDVSLLPRIVDEKESSNSVFHGLNTTVAVVAFAKVQSDRNGAFGAPPLNDTELAHRDHVTTVASLGATLASLIHVGVGRVVVVGSSPDVDHPVAYQTFQKLLNISMASEGVDARDWFEMPESLEAAHPAVIRVGRTDLTFAAVSMDMVNTSYEANNVPKGTQAGLQRAFRNVDPDWTLRWLGPHPDMWKYVYYSEADTLLQTRPSVIQHLLQQMNDGLILSPHRLQLLAYEGDVPDYQLYSPQGQLVPADFKTPVNVNSGEVVLRESGEVDVPAYQHCCDALEGYYRPGRDAYPHCGDFWYKCGWRDDSFGNHTRLLPYQLMRLSHGTGITTLTATEHGRRCHLSRVPCRRRVRADETGAQDAAQ